MLKSVHLAFIVFGLHSALCYDISMPKVYREPVVFTRSNVPIFHHTGGSSIFEIPQQYRNPVDEIIYPCKLTDMNCVRRFLSANSGCHPSYGTVLDPLVIPRLTIPIPAANITLTLNNVITEGLGSARLSTFYYNKSTGNVVISYTITSFTKTVPRTTFTYKRRGKESVSLTDHATFILPSVIFTAVIPRVPNLRLDLAETSSYVSDPNIIAVVGPKAYRSEDPEVKHEFATFMADLPLMAWEAMSVEAPMNLWTLIQINICDFGVEVNFS